MKKRLEFHRRRPGFQDGVPVFSIMRDEKYFFPHFLEHYRQLGIRSFLVLADRCDDEFMAMLESADDVSILLARNMAFGEQFGVQANGQPRRLPSMVKEMLAEHILFQRWHLVVDADEFLVLPPPFGDLESYARFLEAAGQHCGYAPMIDFYPERLGQRNFDRGCSPFEGAPYFDVGPYHAFNPETGQVLTSKIGVRGRIIDKLTENDPDEMARIGCGPGRYMAAKNYKFPLLRSSLLTKRVGDHDAQTDMQLNLSNGCALAHFKFYPELDAKIARAIEEQQYFRGSIEYRFLDLALAKLADQSLLFEGTRRYVSPADLVDAGLLQAIDGL